GDIFLWGDYRFQTNELKTGFSEAQKSGAFSGEINLNTSSFLLHPNFLLIDFGVGYAPGTQNNSFLVAPDRTDNSIAEKANLGLTFFDQRPVSLRAFANYNHSFINRDLTSDVESHQFSTGVTLYPKNDLLPASISYRYDKWLQDELQTLRDFESYRHNITAQIQKKFSADYDEHELIANYDDYFRRYENNISVSNQILRFSLRDRFYFNADKNNGYQSLIWWQNQVESQPYKRFQIDQELFIIPISTLSILGSYQYFKFNTPFVDSRQHDASGEIAYQFYKSLRPFVNYQFTDNKQTFYSEKNNRANFGFNYTKSIPTGALRLNYTYRLQTNNRMSEAVNLVINDEEHLLSDNKFILLDNPGVIESSIKVKDKTRTIIYQENLDYFIFNRGQFTEIRRIPGGQIPDGEKVFVDYESRYSPSYNFSAAGNTFLVGLIVLNNFLDVYFAYNDFDYNNVEGSSFSIFKFFNQRLFGARATINIVSAGFEYDDYNSNITPYRSLRYYVDVSEAVTENLFISINASYRDYLLMPDNETQIFKDVSGRLSYLFTPITKLNFITYTRFQNGRGIDLDFYSFRTEFETKIRNIILKVGYENFYRDYSSEIVNYNNIYLRIGRNF
ncbi:MAG: hypothetical protein Q8M94_05125, partial [Ignavibacteria bacterium]|nr:hypothetical protein [Ignavibacteria bacterium]